MTLRPFWTALILAFGLIAAGCGTTDRAEDDDMTGDTVEGIDPDAEAARIRAEEGATAAGAERREALSAEDLLGDADGPLSERVVYFEFDSSSISGEYADIIQAHGEFLATHPEIEVTVEGHTDERGSREYNLALGENRARAVRRMLTLHGAADEQIEISSFGEEQPIDPGHDAQAWAENRRAELVYQR